MAKVTSPNKSYNGVSAGVRFVEGVGEFDPKKQIAAREYFERHGYSIGSDAPDKPAAVKAAESVDKPLDKLKVAELLAIAETRGTDLTGVDTSKKAPIIEALEKSGRTVVVAEGGVAGEGPAGPQHNEGHDAANPEAEEPQTTPVDAGI